MTTEETLMGLIRRLWAAVVERAILDYRHAIFDNDETEMNSIEKQMEIMGYGEYMPKIKWNALRFKHVVDAEIKRDPKKRRRYMTCPACGAEGRVEIIRRTASLSAICYSCGIRYRFPLWRLEKEDEKHA